MDLKFSETKAMDAARAMGTAFADLDRAQRESRNEVTNFVNDLKQRITNKEKEMIYNSKEEAEKAANEQAVAWMDGGFNVSKKCILGSVCVTKANPDFDTRVLREYKYRALPEKNQLCQVWDSEEKPEFPEYGYFSHVDKNGRLHFNQNMLQGDNEIWDFLHFQPVEVREI